MCAILVSAHRGKGDPPAAPEDFLPWRRRLRETDSPNWENSMKAHFLNVTKKQRRRKDG